MKWALVFLFGLTVLGASPAWDIQARLGADGKQLWVEARYAPGDADGFMADATSIPFVGSVEGELDGVWKALPGKNGKWEVPDGETRGAHLRWRFDLEAASRSKGSGVRPFGSAFLMRPRVWILRPESFLPGRAARLRVETARGQSFVSGLGPGSDLSTRVDALDGGPEAALGPLHTQRFAAKGGEVAAVWPVGESPLTPDQIATWFRGAAGNLVEAYGRLPLPWTAVYLQPVGQRSGILFGSTRGDGGAAIVILVGRTVSDQELSQDWILTHELIHTELPDLDRSHHWLEEGLPTYLEPLLRLRQGRTTPKAFWAALREDLPKGLPQSGDRGLDRTPTWGRTYWGGALFCFVADDRIRQATQGRQTLLDALRALLPAGGIARQGNIRDLLSLGDKALEKPVLLPLYEAWATAPATVDLEAIWKRLGVASEPFDDGAPEAALRKAWNR